jgi:hypothetical protein
MENCRAAPDFRGLGQISLPNGSCFVTNAALQSDVPYRREDADYMRRKAAQLRSIADAVGPEIAGRLREMAEELDALADSIERRPDPRTP